MNAFEQERAEEISSVLAFFYSDFTMYLATTIAFTEALPEEINNQIRDAFTHISRANAADTVPEVQQECRLAKAHIERANRDCLKASIIKARLELDSLIDDAVFFHGFLTPAIKASCGEIKRKRREAYQEETKGTDQLIERLEEILRLTMSLSDEVRNHYSVAGKKRTRFMRWLKRWFRPMAFVVTLLVGTILGVILRAQLERLFS